MASGKPDYWYSMLPGKSTLGQGQSPWFKMNQEIITPGESTLRTIYTVPTNFRLYLTDGMIGCFEPGINRFLIYKDAAIVLNMLFDTIQILPISVDGAYIFEAGEVFKIKIYNFDTINLNTYITFSGFLQYLIS